MIFTTLYKLSIVAMVRSSARRESGTGAAPFDDLAHALQGVLRSSGAGGVARALRQRAVQRQPAQVDAGDAGAGYRTVVVSDLPTLRYRCAVVGAPHVARAARAGTRAPRRVDSRRHGVSQEGRALGRRGAAVQRHAREDRQLPGGGHRRLVDGRTRVARGCGALLAGQLDRRSGAAPQGPHSRRRRLSGEVAARPAVAAAGPRGRVGGHRGGRRCGLRRCHHAAAQPAAAWRTIRWQHGANPPRRAQCAAVRVTPAQDWGKQRRLAPEIWLVCERPDDDADEKYFFIHLPRRTALAQLVALAHQRWPIEQQYQQLKTELGLDHFEGRTFPGWHHHVVLSAVAYAFLQQERMRREPAITFEAIRAIVQEVFVGLLFAARPRYATWLDEARQLLPLRL